MKDYKQTITDILKDLGIPASLSGFHHLRYAIELMKNDMSLMNKISTVLYPTIAKKFNTTWPRVERTMRHAIETGWERGNVQTQNKLFGYTIKADIGKPTNSEFIVTVADYISMLKSEVNTNV